jgi:EamA-like transporter family.
MLKLGLNRLDAKEMSISKIFYLLPQILLNIHIILWFVFALLAMVLWMWGLAYLELSFTYPFLSLGYVIIAVLSAIVLNEHITAARWAAIVIINIGIVLLYKS